MCMRASNHLHLHQFNCLTLNQKLIIESWEIESYFSPCHFTIIQNIVLWVSIKCLVLHEVDHVWVKICIHLYCFVTLSTDLISEVRYFKCNFMYQTEKIKHINCWQHHSLPPCYFCLTMLVCSVPLKYYDCERWE